MKEHGFGSKNYCPEKQLKSMGRRPLIDPHAYPGKYGLFEDPDLQLPPWVVAAWFAFCLGCVFCIVVGGAISMAWR